MKMGISSLLIGILFTICSLSCVAMNTGFTTEDICEEDISTIYERLEIQEIDDSDVSIGFSCFDVNNKGEYILGFNAAQDKILVFSAEGEFLYGFSLKDNGSFGVEWDGENINIYRVRSDLAVSIDTTGNCVEIRKIKNTIENNNYWNHNIKATQRTNQGDIYTAENNLGIFNLLTAHTYSRLVKTLPNGEKIILFDITAQQTVNIMVYTILIGIFVLICTVVLIVFIVRVVNKRKSQR